MSTSRCHTNQPYRSGLLRLPPRPRLAILVKKRRHQIVCRRFSDSRTNLAALSVSLFLAAVIVDTGLSQTVRLLWIK